MSKTDTSRGVSLLCAACGRLYTVTEIPAPSSGVWAGEPGSTVAVEPYTNEHILAAARALPGWKVVDVRCWCPRCVVPALEAVRFRDVVAVVR